MNPKKYNSLKKHGLKVTLPRVKILHMLEASKDRHVSAEDIYSQLLKDGEEVSLATVYRVLSQFEASGMIMRHHFEDGYSVYELDDGQHHDHLVCEMCRKVVEFVDNVIEERQINIAKQHGFEISDHSLYIYGVCKSCQDKANVNA